MARASQASALSFKANKAQCAQFFDVSLPTIDAWIRKGAPVEQRGSQGVSWVIDLRAIAEWVYSSPADANTSYDPNDLPPTDRRAWFQSENERLKFEAEQRELIPAGEVEETVATAFAAIAHLIRGIPDELERKHGLSGEVIELVEDGLMSAQDTLADRLSSLATVET